MPYPTHRIHFQAQILCLRRLDLRMASGLPAPRLTCPSLCLMFHGRHESYRDKKNHNWRCNACWMDMVPRDKNTDDQKELSYLL